MRLLFVASEIYPLAKTGGLADVAASLPVALAEAGVDVRLMLPGYPSAMDTAIPTGRSVAIGDPLAVGETRLIEAVTPHGGLTVWLVDCPSLYRRGGGPYQDDGSTDWPDNHLRFALLSHAAARVALGQAGEAWRPDVVHAHDWQTGLVPALLAAAGPQRPQTLFTIHNVAFQGNFPAETFPRLGLPPWMFSADGVEFYGQVSFLKAGLRYADKLTTVSPTYAHEILTPEYGCGLEGVLQSRAADLVGILNGVDYGLWSPDDRRHVPAPYSTRDMAGKSACKAALQNELGLEPSPDAPLFVFVNRLTEQKMADALPDAVPAVCAQGGQLAVFGRGDASIEARLTAAAARFPGRAAVRIGYDEGFARRMTAGGDSSLVPSRFEPCGLTQLYAMRFGAIPVVSRVGGLSDTVTDADDGAISAGTATGVVFNEVRPDGLIAAIGRAGDLYRRHESWRRVQQSAMTVDFGWGRSAARYLEIYTALAGHPRAEAPAPDARPPREAPAEARRARA
ncbi:MAG: glycogen synthase GlgA [Rhodospirillales bacterium]